MDEKHVEKKDVVVMDEKNENDFVIVMNNGETVRVKNWTRSELLKTFQREFGNISFECKEIDKYIIKCLFEEFDEKMRYEDYKKFRYFENYFMMDDEIKVNEVVCKGCVCSEKIENFCEKCGNCAIDCCVCEITLNCVGDKLVVEKSVLQCVRNVMLILNDKNKLKMSKKTVMKYIEMSFSGEYIFYDIHDSELFESFIYEIYDEDSGDTILKKIMSQYIYLQCFNKQIVIIDVNEMYDHKVNEYIDERMLIINDFKYYTKEQINKLLIHCKTQYYDKDNEIYPCEKKFRQYFH